MSTQNDFNFSLKRDSSRFFFELNQYRIKSTFMMSIQ
jgi:hypothetical protein